MGKCREQMMEYARGHIYENGELLFFSELEQAEEKLEHMLEQKFILQCFEKGERVKLLEYLQKSIVGVKKKDSSRIYLEYFQIDLLQIIGIYLHSQGMDNEFFFTDEGYKRLWTKARTSVFAMIQWTAYYTNKVFDDIRDREKGKGVTDIILDYIHGHYDENINRNSLAEMVHLSPEYVGKMFKKELGVGISEYINKWRIDKAKNLLETTNYKIIDVALMVGYGYNLFITINEQILKFAQSHPTILRTSSSDAPFLIKT